MTAMEQLLDKQRTALQTIMLEQQRSVQLLFADHQRAIERLLSQETQQHSTPRSVLPFGSCKTAPNFRQLSVVPKHERALLTTDESSSESSDEDHDLRLTVSQSQSALPRDSNCLQRALLPVVRSKVFLVTVNLAIILNTLFLGLRIHYVMGDVLSAIKKGQRPHEEYPTFLITSTLFFYFFVIEMALRVLAEQKEFVCGSAKYWNLFEVVCLASMCVMQFPQEWTEHLLGLGNFAALRVMRLLRIFRAARAVRLFAHFKQLRLMLFSIFSCLVSMFWAILLLLLIIFLFALYLEDISATWLLETMTDTSIKTKEVRKSLETDWNGMGAAMVSLIYSISGGISWGELAFPFWSVHIGCGIAYMGFVVLTIFGLLNVLVGVFVQEAEALSKWDQDYVTDIADFFTKRKKKDKQISRLFSRLDTARMGAVSLQDLHRSLEEEKIQSKFEELGVNVAQVQVLLKVIDVDGNGQITREEFTQGLSKLHSRANATDVAVSLIEEQKVDAKMESFKDAVCSRIDMLCHRLDGMGKH